MDTEPLNDSAGAWELAQRACADNLQDEMIEALLRCCEERPSFAMHLKCGRLLESAPPIGLPEVRVALLGSYTFEPLAYHLMIEGLHIGKRLQCYCSPFQQFRQDILDVNSPLHAFAPDIIFLMLSLETLLPLKHETYLQGEANNDRIEQVMRALRELIIILRESYTGPLVISDFQPAPHVSYGIGDYLRPDGLHGWHERLNRDLRALAGSFSDVYLLSNHRDLDSASSSTLNQFYGALPVPLDRHYLLGRLCCRFINALFGTHRKCIVVDLDNTLWGGILGEDGQDGILLGDYYPGSVYKQFQEALLAMKKTGILLAICSKNNPADVTRVLREHPGMVLREDDFAEIQVGWQDKHIGVMEIARRLDIGFDSLVFVDDSPIECQLIRSKLPEVAVLPFSREQPDFLKQVERSYIFDRLVFSDEDMRRGELYTARRNVIELEKTCEDKVDFLQSLATEMCIFENNLAHLPRVVQMMQRVTQFNLTGYKADLLRLNGYLESGNHVYTAQLRDRYTDHGVCGAALCCRCEDGPADCIQIKAFLVSCRALGRDVEYDFLEDVLARLREKGIAEVRAHFQTTARNGVAESFLRTCGFRTTGNSAYGVEYLLTNERSMTRPRPRCNHVSFSS